MYFGYCDCSHAFFDAFLRCMALHAFALRTDVADGPQPDIRPACAPRAQAGRQAIAQYAGQDR
jgi:hypothetical protein